MRKIIYSFLSLVLFLFIILTLLLSTIGIETDKFNKLIIDKALFTKNISLKLNTIKFKINIKKVSLFLETLSPQIEYREVSLPVQSIKVYIDFTSLLKSDPKIKKTTIILEELDIVQLNKLSKIIKPSNFKSLLNNKIEKGKLISEIEIFFTDKGDLKNFIAKGTVKDLKVNLFEGLNFSKGNFSFFSDKSDILIKNIFGNIEDINISDGDVKLNLENGIKVTSNFNSKINLNEKLLKKYSKFLGRYQFFNSVKVLKADFKNNLSINLDNTYKVNNFSYDISGEIIEGKLEFKNPIKNDVVVEEIKEVYFSNLQISTNFQPNKIYLNGKGKYSFDNLDFLKIDFENEIKNKQLNLIINLDYGKSLELNIINYKKPKKTVANLSLNLKKERDNIIIDRFSFKDGKNLISINDLKLKKNKFSSFKKIEVFTENNDFSIQNEKKIFIKGDKLDASNLSKFITEKKGKNNFKNINNTIEIEFNTIKVPLSEKLQNFKLIGEIKNGQFIKISSKGDFGGNNFLDISMKKDKNSGKKYLEIYSDLTRPLLAEYSFFSGLSGGNLLYTSVIDKSITNSKLKIENFKVINAPGVIKLLALADLKGLADLAEGEGLSFDSLEIDLEKNKDFLKLNEILALGPSMSVLMEGYQDGNGLTSLRGTLVPAKTLNKMISKIPVIGGIVVPKEAGEGLFGISFKMKGPKGNIKTTINPIRTLTPRFIQKIIDKNKETK